MLQEAERTARRVLQEVHDTYFLVIIVDNDYVSESSIDALFRDVITEAMSEAELRLRVKDLEAEASALRREVLRLRDTLITRDDARALELNPALHRGDGEPADVTAAARRAAFEWEARASVAPPMVTGGGGVPGGGGSFMPGPRFVAGPSMPHAPFPLGPQFM
ncbi:hypothetical protein EON67_01755 [archaeon]|nr:MAG: hypothetical protein EON67_01755 [archaeon]